MIKNNPKNRELVRKLRANGDKVIHFLHLFDGYVLSSSSETKSVANVCDPSLQLFTCITPDKLEEYVPKLVRNDFKVIIG